MHARPTLRLLPDPVAPAKEVFFCGHCGEAPPETEETPARVCSRCGLGVVIAASEDLAPRPGDAFVMVDRRLMLCGLSRDAERLLGLVEPEAVDRHVTEFLEPADAEAAQGDELLRALIASAAGCAESQSVFVRPAGEYGVRFNARVGPCGPPAGALIVLTTV